ncbi:MAG: hypothetical protein HW380_3996 [Magnetococcales bacterium]|nr:hypothetical protein [Magnetococcales bacterium]
MIEHSLVLKGAKMSANLSEPSRPTGSEKAWRTGDPAHSSPAGRKNQQGATGAASRQGTSARKTGRGGNGEAGTQKTAISGKGSKKKERGVNLHAGTCQLQMRLPWTSSGLTQRVTSVQY